MRCVYLILLLIPLSIFAYGKNDSIIYQNEIISLKNDIKNINNELSKTTSQLKEQGNLDNKTYNSISAQLNGASYSITIFGLLFAIAAIILGIYVTRIENKVIQLRDENKFLLTETIKNKEEVVQINNLIQSDINSLYLKIKREETTQLLKRLVLIPEDIENISDLLYSRELEKDDFKIFKKAYENLMLRSESQKRFFEQHGISLEDNYKNLFFQHFLDLSLKDDMICNEIVDFFDKGINSAFENDVSKSTNDFMTAIIDMNIRTKEKEINSYIKGISQSIYKDSKFVYEIFFNKLQNRNMQFDFFNLINDNNECKAGKSNYGKILKEKYSSTELSLSEQNTINKINSLT